MEKTVFQITKMDCPSEENLIRMKLGHIQEIKNLEFDIPNRKLTVIHADRLHEIENCIVDLNLGGRRLSTEQSNQFDFRVQSNQRKLLWTVLIINFGFFVIEIVTGLISKSMGLVADSLDMLADSLVYGLSLYAVGGTIARKKTISRIAGYFQIILAIIGFSEVIRRFIGVADIPNHSTMISISFLALIANIICLYILFKSKSKEAHMQASMIFTSNDVIINLGVIVAGILVAILNSNKPDLIVGAIVFSLVIHGAIRILKLGK